jgi:hypothetical protein
VEADVETKTKDGGGDASAGADTEIEKETETSFKWVHSVSSFWRNRMNPGINEYSLMGPNQIP